MGIALAKSQSARELSHQLAFMGSCLTISHTCLPSHAGGDYYLELESIFGCENCSFEKFKIIDITLKKQAALRKR